MPFLLTLFGCLFARLNKIQRQRHKQRQQPAPPAPPPPQTFPRFSELPTEMQMMIWREAAHPEPSFALHPIFFIELKVQRALSPIEWTVRDRSRAFVRLVEGDELSGVMEPVGWGEKIRDVAAATSLARSGLRRTCRLARCMMWEEWKRDIRGIEMNHLTAGKEEGFKVPLCRMLDLMIAFDGMAMSRNVYAKLHRRVLELRKEGAKRLFIRYLEPGMEDLSRLGRTRGLWRMKTLTSE